MCAASDFPRMLHFWKPFVEGDKELFREANGKLAPHAQNEITSLVQKGMDDLQALMNEFHNAKLAGRMNKHALHDICSIAEVVQRVLNDLINENRRRKQPIVDNKMACFCLVHLFAMKNFFFEFIPQLQIKELEPGEVLKYLRALDPEMAASQALLNCKGLITQSILNIAYNLDGRETTERIFKNANLSTVEELIHLFEKTQSSGMNFFQIIKYHIQQNSMKALQQLGEEEKKGFYAKLYKEPDKDRIHQGRIFEAGSYGSNKIDIWDYLKQQQLEKEVSKIGKDNFYRNIQLFQGADNDYFLIIDNCIYNRQNFIHSAKTILGAANHSRLKKYVNYFWSPNGLVFFQMKKLNYSGFRKFYDITFKKPESFSHSNMQTINMHVRCVYVNLLNADHDILNTYERLSINVVKEIVGSAFFQIVPVK